MKKMNNKGFTIVELVIVIAVIAILAAVMIPTFSGIVTKAQESAEMQKVAAAYKEAYAMALADDGKIATGNTLKETETVEGYAFEFTVNANNALTNVSITKAGTGFSYSWTDGKITATKTNG